MFPYWFDRRDDGESFVLALSDYSLYFFVLDFFFLKNGNAIRFKRQYLRVDHECHSSDWPDVIAFSQ